MFYFFWKKGRWIVKKKKEKKKENKWDTKHTLFNHQKGRGKALALSLSSIHTGTPSPSQLKALSLSLSLRLSRIRHPSRRYPLSSPLGPPVSALRAIQFRERFHLVIRTVIGNGFRWVLHVLFFFWRFLWVKIRSNVLFRGGENWWRGKNLGFWFFFFFLFSLLGLRQTSH